MRGIVCVKHVPDTTELRLDPATGRPLLEFAPPRMNDYDRHAVEAAAQLRAAHGGEVTALCVGPPGAEKTLKEVLAAGADSALLLTGPWAAALDPAATATLLAALCRRAGGFDLAICGEVSEDGYNGLVPAMLASLLGVRFAGSATGLAVDGEMAVVTTAAPGGSGSPEHVDLPAVVSVTRAINTPRVVTTLQIIRVPAGRITTLSAADLGIDEAELAPERQATRLVGTRPAASARRNQILHGTAEEQVAQLLESLSAMGALA